ncbi:MAG TPA: MlaD family protein [Nocardioidaceae bacterium]|nr:MlaD family protein [Nocardioidaceae bacterium]
MRHQLTRSWPVAVLLGFVAFAAVVTSSGVSLLSLPSIGGVRGDTYHLTLEFENALNLPDRAFVRVNGVDVGTVTSIATKDYAALVGVDIREDVSLSEGTTAQLRQASPLGDVFVALTPPDDAASPLTDGATIELERTGAAPQIEDLLSAASIVLNGGALVDLATIVREMNDFLGGNEQHVAGLLGSVGDLSGVLNRRSADIDALLVEFEAATRTFSEHRVTIRRALSGFTPAIRVVAEERARIMTLLRKVSRLGVPISELARRSGDDLVASLVSFTEVMRGFADIGAGLGPTLHDMLELAKVAEFSTRGENLAGVGYAELSPALVGFLQ